MLLVVTTHDTVRTEWELASAFSEALCCTLTAGPAGCDPLLVSVLTGQQPPPSQEQDRQALLLKFAAYLGIPSNGVTATGGEATARTTPGAAPQVAAAAAATAAAAETSTPTASVPTGADDDSSVRTKTTVTAVAVAGGEGHVADRAGAAAADVVVEAAGANRPAKECVTGSEAQAGAREKEQLLAFAQAKQQLQQPRQEQKKRKGHNLRSSREQEQQDGRRYGVLQPAPLHAPTVLPPSLHKVACSHAAAAAAADVSLHTKPSAAACAQGKQLQVVLSGGLKANPASKAAVEHHHMDEPLMDTAPLAGNIGAAAAVAAAAASRANGVDMGNGRRVQNSALAAGAGTRAEGRTTAGLQSAEPAAANVAAAAAAAGGGNKRAKRREALAMLLQVLLVDNSSSSCSLSEGEQVRGAGRGVLAVRGGTAKAAAVGAAAAKSSGAGGVTGATAAARGGGGGSYDASSHIVAGGTGLTSPGVGGHGSGGSSDAASAYPRTKGKLIVGWGVLLADGRGKTFTAEYKTIRTGAFA